MASYIDHEGNNQQVDLQGVLFHKMAAEAKLSLRQFINREHPTKPGDPDAFSQMCINAGLRFKSDDDHGVPAANLKDMLDPSFDPKAAVTNQTGGTYTSAPQTPDSLILFPAALLEAMEDALSVNRSAAVNAFESLIGYKKTIASDRYERPYINYDGKMGPQDSQFQRIAQNARPPLMLSITASDVTQTIPTTSIGMEISQKALAENSLDLVALTMTRFLQVADYNEWIVAMLGILQGDVDGPTTPISDDTAALDQVKVDVYDVLETGTGSMTQLAWLKYLYNNSMMMTKTHIVTDFDGAYAMEIRTNRPTNVMNNSTDRLDTPFQVIYPDFTDTLGVIIMPAGSGWPVNTLMGLDKAYALAKITSSSVDYSATEEIVMKRSREFRYDRGFIVHRLFKDSFDVLSLTQTT